MTERPTPPPLESFASGAACETCGGAGDIFTNPTWNNDPQFEEDHPCPSCGGAGVDPGPQWATQ
jgi:DnaJ-class molecular chaperone